MMKFMADKKNHQKAKEMMGINDDNHRTLSKSESDDGCIKCLKAKRGTSLVNAPREEEVGSASYHRRRKRV